MKWIQISDKTRSYLVNFSQAFVIEGRPHKDKFQLRLGSQNENIPVIATFNVIGDGLKALDDIYAFLRDPAQSLLQLTADNAEVL